jgi:flagellar biosynthesis/type III secretory pathway protein FliH
MRLFKPNDAAASYIPSDLSVEKEKAKETRFDQKDFALDQKGFLIDPQVASHIGLTAAKGREEKRQFDTEVLKYVQKIKDDAYSEAFKKGELEGITVAKAEALESAAADIKKRLDSLMQIMDSIDNQRKKMYEVNEAEIIRFCYYIAEKIVLQEVTHNKEYIIDFIKKVIPDDEACVIRLNRLDYDFVQTHQQLIAKEFNLSTIKFEVEESFQEGDVVVETANGILDGSLSSRLEKLKKALEQLD